MENERLRNKILCLEADLQNSITWTVDDFASRASELDGSYDPTKFEDALATMIKEYGSTAEIIDFYLNELCRVDTRK